MLHPQQVIDTYFLENRHMLLEIAAFLDRYDVAKLKHEDSAVHDEKLVAIQQSLQTLYDRTSDTPRVERLLELFATV